MTAFDPSHFNSVQFDLGLRTLNEQLARIHQVSGLAPALQGLFDQQQHAGFLKDSLRDMTVHRLDNRLDRSEWFVAQYNPNRRDRILGRGRSEPPVGLVSVNNNCFLDLQNILWQQQGLQMGYSLALDNLSFWALVNPFPLKPLHLTVASDLHMPQQQPPERVVAHLLALVKQLPDDFYAFWNGVNAGATVPLHYHLQVVTGGPFPADAAAAAVLRTAGWAVLDDYPLPAIVLQHSDPAYIVRMVSLVAQRWLEVARQAATANIIAKHCGEHLIVYFVPRHRRFATTAGLSGEIASLEWLGELVLCTPQEEEGLKSGDISFRFVERMLAAVRPPMVDLLFRRLLEVADTVNESS